MQTISILIPTRDAERFIRSAIQSVLTQKNVDLDVVVVDDGGTDRSIEIVQSINDPRVRIIPGPRRGISAAFNAGLEAARGEWVARCDADDLYPPDRLEWQAKFLSEHPEFGAICGDFAVTNERASISAYQHVNEPAEEVTDELRRGVGRSHVCAYLFRTALLRQIGGCREWFVTSEDRDLQYRLAEISRIWYEPRRSYLYRLHDQSITHTQKLGQRVFYEQMALRFQLQRRDGGLDDLQKGTPPPMEPGLPAHPPQSAAQQIQNILIGRAWKEHGAGMKCRAITSGWQACLAQPSSVQTWKSLFALLVKSSSTQSKTREN